MLLKIKKMYWIDKIIFSNGIFNDSCNFREPIIINSYAGKPGGLEGI